jgi:hypothetical protein
MTALAMAMFLTETVKLYKKVKPKNSVSNEA